MQSNKVLFVNHSEQACGVQQYGRRVFNVFKQSQEYTSVYCEPKSEQDLQHEIDTHNPVTIIYNYLGETMPWLSHSFLRNVKIPQGLIVHNIGYLPLFDYYLHQNPSYTQNGCNYPLLRPLFNYKPEPRPNKVVKIGTFGFGFKVKGYEKICELVNHQFSHAEIHMHLTLSHFRPNVEELQEVHELCRSKITKPNISVKFTSDFKDDKGLLDFLAGNDLNVFLYQNYNHYNGISSVIDYALSAKRPVAVCKSNMFAHINGASPSICAEESHLSTIIQNGTKPIDHFIEEWSPEKFTENLNKIIKKEITI
tara:strand:- start:350 stop:1276 length:927 start_codon:yes stop_codon:yes gene_type:complete